MTSSEDQAWATVAANSLVWSGDAGIGSVEWREAWAETVAEEIRAQRLAAEVERRAAFDQLRKQRRQAAARLVRDDWDAEKTEEADEFARKEEADSAWMGRRMMRRVAMLARTKEAEVAADAEDVAEAAAWSEADLQIIVKVWAKAEQATEKAKAKAEWEADWEAKKRGAGK